MYLEPRSRQPKDCRQAGCQMHIPHSAPCNARGFTLLEVMVAGAILSLILAALYGVFSRILASKRSTEERAARLRAAHTVLLRISEDLQGSFPFTAAEESFRGETRQENGFPTAFLSFVSVAQLALTAQGSAGDLRRVEYRLVPDPVASSHYQLVRSVRLDLRADQDTADELVPLLLHVRGLRVRFFDGQRWAEEWGRETTRGRLPQAVEVTLYVDGQTDTEVSALSTTVGLPLAGGPYREAS